MGRPAIDSTLCAVTYWTLVVFAMVFCGTPFSAIGNKSKTMLDQYEFRPAWRMGADPGGPERGICMAGNALSVLGLRVRIRRGCALSGGHGVLSLPVRLTCLAAICYISPLGL